VLAKRKGVVARQRLKAIPPENNSEDVFVATPVSKDDCKPSTIVGTDIWTPEDEGKWIG